MAYLIDGNNFIGYISRSSLKDPRSKLILISKLQIFQHLKRTRIIIVFDGYPDPNIIGKHLRRKNFSVFYPPHGQNADQLIKEIILKQTYFRRFYVVSSDREVQLFAKSKGAKTLNCEEFSRQLIKALKEYKNAKEEEKKVTFPSPLEINQWLEIFKGKK
ncbi:MAG: NYN domain-containing protein [Candidatus Aminicenantaceae bacterium]